MNKKNFQIKKYPNPSTKLHARSHSNMTIQSSRMQRISVRASQREQQSTKIVTRVKQIWETVVAMGIQISDSAILKYLKKLMNKKCFHYQQIILELLRTKQLPKGGLNMDQETMIKLLYQLEKMRQEFEQFLWRRFCRDIDIMEERIIQADIEIRDSVDLPEYMRLTSSLRPTLISNPSDLANEYQNIASNTIRLNFSKMQQMRYGKLTLSSRRICALHNAVCDQKSGVKLFKG